MKSKPPGKEGIRMTEGERIRDYSNLMLQVLERTLELVSLQIDLIKEIRRLAEGTEEVPDQEFEGQECQQQEGL
jgi:hypothetical protein